MRASTVYNVICKIKPAALGSLALLCSLTSAAESGSSDIGTKDCKAGLRLYPADRNLIDSDLLVVLPVLTAMDKSAPSEKVSANDSTPESNIAETRKRLREMMKLRPPLAAESDGVLMQERNIPGLKDSTQVRVLVYTPTSKSTLRPAILDIHGGAFVLGSADDGDATNRRLAKDVNAVIVSVDYRLAPEHPFPAAIDDSYAALEWLHGHAAELGVDPTKVAVMGGSAGGGLAASLALLARDKGKIPIKGQFLIYPSLDDRAFTKLDPTCAPGTAVPLERAYGMYLGTPELREDVSPYAFAARAQSLVGLPPAFIAVGAVDGLADQDIAYARRLIQSGVATELHVYPGAFHGFNMASEAGVSRKFYSDLRSSLQRILK